MGTERRQKIYKVIMLIILTAFVTFIVTSLALYKTGYLLTKDTKYTMVATPEESVAIDLMIMRETINKYFLNDIDEQKVKEGAIKGYVEGLGDEYTEYMTKEEMKSFYEEALGSFEGIGIYMTKDLELDAVVVISPIKNSPAFAAGMLPGDIITKVDDVSCIGEDTTAVSKRIKGEAGTTVKIEVVRDRSETLTFEIVREKIKIHFVEGEVIEKNIGYIEVVSFDEGTAQEFEKKYNELKEQNIKSLIIDLRNNPGGLVDEALDIADLFVPKGEILITTIGKGEKRKEYKAKREDVIIDIPVVILVNENSASASEILAGTLKDHKKATIVGVKTFGKGVIQELLTLLDGSGLKITTSEYHTPSDNKIHKVGIEPDHIVELPEDLENILLIPEGKDTQLQKAIELLR